MIEAGYSRFTYGYARFGQAAPDGLMDLIPVTERAASTDGRNFSYRGVFDPLDFGFNDNEALNSSWRGSLAYVTGSHNMKVGYMRHVHRGAQRPRAGPHAAALHVQRQRAGQRRVSCRWPRENVCARPRVSYFLSPRWDQHDRTQTDGRYTHRISGRSGV